MNGFGKTDVGKKRNTNQDFVFVSNEPIGPFPNLYVVADGMGGHKAGDHASSFATKKLIELLKSDSSEEQPIAVLRKALEEVNEEVIMEADSNSNYHGMGTTMVVATIDKNIVYVANIGDSRLYVLSDDIRQITVDHSLVEELVQKGELTPKEAKKHPRKNIITRAIGVMPGAEPDFYEVPFEGKERILICTDGLSNMVEDEEIYSISRKSEDLEDAVSTLIEKANEYGGYDNIGIVMIEND